VLPPLSQLTPEQAVYHFLSGYTARVAGTERGVTEPQATFSACFGAPFMPRHPSIYGNLLKERIAKGNVTCWLVNTGWTGGKATMPGISRMPIKATRALLNAALDGSLNAVEFAKDPNFGFDVPVAVLQQRVRVGAVDGRSAAALIGVGGLLAHAARARGPAVPLGGRQVGVGGAHLSASTPANRAS
jgi:ATP-dependent phosphoenolpyruvate carboxykinase